MSEYLIQDTTLIGIADKIRPLLGLTGTMTPEQMQTNLTTEQTNIAAALAALTEKGVEVPAGANSNALAGLIAALEVGGGGSVFLGNITPSEDVTTIEVEHNLGAIPENVILIRGPKGTISKNQTLFTYSNKSTGARCVYGGTTSGSNMSMGVSVYTGVSAWSINGNFVIADEKKVTITVPEATMVLSAGITYTIVCEVAE